MSDTSSVQVPVQDSDDGAIMEARLFRMMFVVVGLGAAGSLVYFPWRVSTGLILGGGLSLLNYHLLRTSIFSAFAKSVVRINTVRFLLRYCLPVIAITAAYLTGIASLTAALVGMGSFAVAGLLEGIMQAYFIIAGREGN